MVFKSYFDGANQADSKLYEVLTLASFSGSLAQWRNFETDWNENLKRHDAPWLHTTDAVSLKREPFTRVNGWDKKRRDAFLSNCVSVVERHLAVSKQRFGLVPYVVSLVLKDFIKSGEINPEVPKNAAEACVVQGTYSVLKQGIEYGAHFFHFVFDQNEPFRGHILDRQNNKKAKQHLEPMLERITSNTEADMRQVPALQAADLIAWCVTNRLRKPLQRWQARILRRTTVDWLTYEKLVRPIPGVNDLVQSWNLPKRKPTR